MLSKINQAIVKNPKTSLAGLGTIIGGLLGAFHVVTAEQAVAIASAFAAFGLLLSGDAK